MCVLGLSRIRSRSLPLVVDANGKRISASFPLIQDSNDNSNGPAGGGPGFGFKTGGSNGSNHSIDDQVVDADRPGNKSKQNGSYNSPSDFIEDSPMAGADGNTPSLRDQSDRNRPSQSNLRGDSYDPSIGDSADKSPFNGRPSPSSVRDNRGRSPLNGKPGPDTFGDSGDDSSRPNGRGSPNGGDFGQNPQNQRADSSSIGDNPDSPLNRSNPGSDNGSGSGSPGDKNAFSANPGNKGSDGSSNGPRGGNNRGPSNNFGSGNNGGPSNGSGNKNGDGSPNGLGDSPGADETSDLFNPDDFENYPSENGQNGDPNHPGDLSIDDINYVIEHGDAGDEPIKGANKSSPNKNAAPGKDDSDLFNNDLEEIPVNEDEGSDRAYSRDAQEEVLPTEDGEFSDDPAKGGAKKKKSPAGFPSISDSGSKISRDGLPQMEGSQDSGDDLYGEIEPTYSNDNLTSGPLGGQQKNDPQGGANGLRNSNPNVQDDELQKASGGFRRDGLPDLGQKSNGSGDSNGVNEFGKSDADLGDDRMQNVSDNLRKDGLPDFGQKSNDLKTNDQMIEDSAKQNPDFKSGSKNSANSLGENDESESLFDDAEQNVIEVGDLDIDDSKKAHGVNSSNDQLKDFGDQLDFKTKLSEQVSVDDQLENPNKKTQVSDSGIPSKNSLENSLDENRPKSSLDGDDLSTSTRLSGDNLIDSTRYPLAIDDLVIDESTSLDELNHSLTRMLDKLRSNPSEDDLPVLKEKLVKSLMICKQKKYNCNEDGILRMISKTEYLISQHPNHHISPQTEDDTNVLLVPYLAFNKEVNDKLAQTSGHIHQDTDTLIKWIDTPGKISHKDQNGNDVSFIDPEKSSAYKHKDALDCDKNDPVKVKTTVIYDGDDGESEGAITEIISEFRQPVDDSSKSDAVKAKTVTDGNLSEKTKIAEGKLVKRRKHVII